MSDKESARLRMRIDELEAAISLIGIWASIELETEGTMIIDIRSLCATCLERGQ